MFAFFLSLHSWSLSVWFDQMFKSKVNFLLKIICIAGSEIVFFAEKVRKNVCVCALIEKCFFRVIFRFKPKQTNKLPIFNHKCAVLFLNYISLPVLYTDHLFWLTKIINQCRSLISMIFIEFTHVRQQFTFWIINRAVHYVNINNNNNKINMANILVKIQPKKIHKIVLLLNV